MAYPHTPKIIFPLKEYTLNSTQFKEECTHKNVYWWIHLGEDISQPAGTKINSIGRGKVIYSALHPGSSQKGNWGNIIIIAHKNPKNKTIFFSLYAHLQERLAKKDERVNLGQEIGKIGQNNTPENGWWKDEHLHFAIYTGPWQWIILPGYRTTDSTRTKLEYWQEPTKFITNYNN